METSPQGWLVARGSSAATLYRMLNGDAFSMKISN